MGGGELSMSGLDGLFTIPILPDDTPESYRERWVRERSKSMHPAQQSALMSSGGPTLRSSRTGESMTGLAMDFTPIEQEFDEKIAPNFGSIAKQQALAEMRERMPEIHRDMQQALPREPGEDGRQYEALYMETMREAVRGVGMDPALLTADDLRPEQSLGRQIGGGLARMPLNLGSAAMGVLSGAGQVQSAFQQQGAMGPLGTVPGSAMTAFGDMVSDEIARMQDPRTKPLVGLDAFAAPPPRMPVGVSEMFASPQNFGKSAISELPTLAGQAGLMLGGAGAGRAVAGGLGQFAGGAAAGAGMNFGFGFDAKVNELTGLILQNNPGISQAEARQRAEAEALQEQALFAAIAGPLDYLPIPGAEQAARLVKGAGRGAAIGRIGAGIAGAAGSEFPTEMAQGIAQPFIDRYVGETQQPMPENMLDTAAQEGVLAALTAPLVGGGVAMNQTAQIQRREQERRQAAAAVPGAEDGRNLIQQQTGGQAAQPQAPPATPDVAAPQPQADPNRVLAVAEELIADDPRLSRREALRRAEWMMEEETRSTARPMPSQAPQESAASQPRPAQPQQRNAEPVSQRAERLFRAANDAVADLTEQDGDRVTADRIRAFAGSAVAVDDLRPEQQRAVDVAQELGVSTIVMRAPEGNAPVAGMMVSPGLVMVADTQGSDAFAGNVIHETLHGLRRHKDSAPAWQALYNAVAAKHGDALEAAIDEYAADYERVTGRKLTEEQARDEGLSRLAEKNAMPILEAMADPETTRRMAESSPAAMQRFMDWVIGLARKIGFQPLARVQTWTERNGAARDQARLAMEFAQGLSSLRGAPQSRVNLDGRTRPDAAPQAAAPTQDTPTAPVAAQGEPAPSAEEFVAKRFADPALVSGRPGEVNAEFERLLVDDLLANYGDRFKSRYQARKFVRNFYRADRANTGMREEPPIPAGQNTRGVGYAVRRAMLEGGDVNVTGIEAVEDTAYAPGTTSGKMARRNAALREQAIRRRTVENERQALQRIGERGRADARTARLREAGRNPRQDPPPDAAGPTADIRPPDGPAPTPRIDRTMFGQSTTDAITGRQNPMVYETDSKPDAFRPETETTEADLNDPNQGTLDQAVEPVADESPAEPAKPARRPSDGLAAMKDGDLQRLAASMGLWSGGGRQSLIRRIRARRRANETGDANDRLLAMEDRELQKLARKLGLDVVGSRRNMIRRIRAKQAADAKASAPLELEQMSYRQVKDVAAQMGINNKGSKRVIVEAIRESGQPIPQPSAAANQPDMRRASDRGAAAWDVTENKPKMRAKSIEDEAFVRSSTGRARRKATLLEPSTEKAVGRVPKARLMELLEEHRKLARLTALNNIGETRKYRNRTQAADGQAYNRIAKSNKLAQDVEKGKVTKPHEILLEDYWFSASAWAEFLDSEAQAFAYYPDLTAELMIRAEGDHGGDSSSLEETGESMPWNKLPRTYREEIDATGKEYLRRQLYDNRTGEWTLPSEDFLRAAYGSHETYAEYVRDQAAVPVGLDTVGDNLSPQLRARALKALAKNHIMLGGDARVLLLYLEANGLRFDEDGNVGGKFTIPQRGTFELVDPVSLKSGTRFTFPGSQKGAVVIGPDKNKYVVMDGVVIPADWILRGLPIVRGSALPEARARWEDFEIHDSITPNPAEHLDLPPISQEVLDARAAAKDSAAWMDDDMPLNVAPGPMPDNVKAAVVQAGKGMVAAGVTDVPSWVRGMHYAAGPNILAHVPDVYEEVYNAQDKKTQRKMADPAMVRSLPMQRLVSYTGTAMSLTSMHSAEKMLGSVRKGKRAGRTDVRNPGSTLESQMVINSIDQVLEDAGLNPERKDAQEMLNAGIAKSKEPGAEQDLTSRVMSGDMLNDTDQIAVLMLMDKRAGQWATDPVDKQTTTMMLAAAGRMSGTETARALVARRLAYDALSPQAKAIKNATDFFAVHTFGELKQIKQIDWRLTRNPEAVEPPERKELLEKRREIDGRRFKRAQQAMLNANKMLAKAGLPPIDQLTEEQLLSQKVLDIFAQANVGPRVPTGSFWIETLMSLRQTAILSGLQTGVGNFFGTPLYASTRFVNKFFVAAVNEFVRDPDLPRLDEIALGLNPYHLGRALASAVVQILKMGPTMVPGQLPVGTGQGIDALLGDRQQLLMRRMAPGIPGKIPLWLTYPVTGGDAGWRAWTLHMEGRARALRSWRKAVDDGTIPNPTPRMKHLWVESRASNPRSQEYLSAYNEYRIVAFQDPPKHIGTLPDKIDGALPGALGGMRIIRQIAIFPGTIERILSAGFRTTPLGAILKVVSNQYQAAVPKNERANDVASLVTTLGLLALIVGAAKDRDEYGRPKWITGSAPRGSKRASAARDAMFDSNIPPMSFRIPGTDKWVSYAWAEPFATVLSLTADAATIINKWEDGIEIGEDMTWHEKGVRGVEALIGRIRDQPFAKGISDIMLALETGDMTRFTTQYAASFVPNIIRRPAMSTDDFVRESRGGGQDTPERLERAGDIFFYRTFPSPGNANRLGVLPKRTVFGEQLERGRLFESDAANIAYRILSPANVTSANIPPRKVSLLLWAYNTANPAQARYFTAPSDVIIVETADAKRRKIVLNAGQHDRLLEESGKQFGKVADNFVANKSKLTARDVDILMQLREQINEQVRVRLFSDEINQARFGGGDD